ncbi:MAG: hypothetical protein GF353_12880 [Candidatus Lokiarchaeota archaeon]|nr:hypothetical protein [Candidatus Lokiarchaeota archaeon]
MVLTKTQKRILVYIIAIVVSSYIWFVNGILFGNTFTVCLILSTTTFLIIVTPFEIYFSFRDLYFERWNPFYDDKITKIKYHIKVKEGFLRADLVRLGNNEINETNNTIIVISPGFSDKKESLEYLYYPLVTQGYEILVYDARGIGESKKAGHRGDMTKRLDDFRTIINWIKTNQKFKNKRIFAIGVSIGALTIFCSSFRDREVKKMVGLSCISKYKKNVMNARGIVKLSFSLKGIDLNPSEEEDKLLSPYNVFKSAKKDFPKEEWQILSKRVMLIHAKNDNIIPFENFVENSRILDLPETNQLILEKGGHNQKKNELAIVGAIIRFLN